MTLTKEQKERLAFEVSEVFTPAAPINEKDLFAGRREQLRRVIDAVNQRGQHAIIFGERGVGKTSLANVLAGFVRQVVLAPRVNCDAADDYASVWKKVFAEIELAQKTRGTGFVPVETASTVPLVETLPKKITPEVVRQTLAMLGRGAPVIVIIDEFDRLGDADPSIRRLVADTIKTLSDHAIPVTLVVVGVADTVEALIEEHHSVERALVQIQMPRMSRTELEELVHKGLARLNMQIDPIALYRMTALSQGLPHYTHLLGLHATRAAIDAATETVTAEHIVNAIDTSLGQAQHSIRSAHHKATMSQRKDNLYAKVLLACALAETDDLAYFAPSDVRDPLSSIMKKRYEIPSFARHLNHFCEASRGSVLQRTGVKHRYRFRFVNPLLQPFVLMQGLNDGLIEGRLFDIPPISG
ncbi:MAG TPA: ATP-binding protein [Methylomirabilota bacterium]|nr:ATP-binding protein [Methylomirabilota bacterium]